MILSFRELQHSIPSRSGAYSHSDKDVKLGLHTYIIYILLHAWDHTNHWLLWCCNMFFACQTEHYFQYEIPAQCSFRWWVWFAHSKLDTMSLEMFWTVFLDIDHVWSCSIDQFWSFYLRLFLFIWMDSNMSQKETRTNLEKCRAKTILQSAVSLPWGCVELTPSLPCHSLLHSCLILTPKRFI